MNEKATKPPPDSLKRALDWAPLLAVLFITATVYSTTWSHEMSWDDRLFLQQSRPAGDIDNLPRAFTVDFWAFARVPELPEKSPLYRPLALALLLLERFLFGRSPYGFRLVHTLLHLLNISLVFVLAKKLLKGRLIGSVLGPTVAAAALAAFPHTVDTVLLLTSVSDLMVTCFALLATFFSLHWLTAGRLVWLGGVLVTSMCAMLSKESAVAVPFIVGGISIQYQKAPNFRRIKSALLASALGVVASLGLRLLFIEAPPLTSLLSLAGWLPADLALAFSYFFRPASIVLEQEPVRTILHPLFAAGCAGLVILGVFTFFDRLKSAALTFVLVSIVSLIPSLLALRWTGIFAPRYLYLPTVGFGLALACLSSLRPWIIRGLPLIYIVAAFGFALIRTADWRNERMLWAAEVSHRPESLTALLNLSNALAKNGEVERAYALALKVASLAESKGASCRAAFAYSNAATLLSRSKRDMKDPVELFERAVRLCPKRAQNAWLGLARLYGRLGDWPRAEKAARNALPGPRRAVAEELLEKILAMQGKTAKPEAQFEQTAPHTEQHADKRLR